MNLGNNFDPWLLEAAYPFQTHGYEPLYLANTVFGGLKELDKIVFSFAWLPHQLSVVASQLEMRQGSRSACALLRQADRFYKPWHAYDEWENRRTGRAEHFVTAAGGFATALHHMLLAETQAGLWSLFPGTPDEWQDLHLENLHTRAGWIVSASLRDGRLTHLEARPVGPAADPVFRLKIRHPLSAPLQSDAPVDNEVLGSSTVIEWKL
jgi:hypothetical protein